MVASEGIVLKKLDEATSKLEESQEQIKKLKEKSDKDKRMMERRLQRVSTTSSREKVQMENKFKVEAQNLKDELSRTSERLKETEQKVATLNNQLLEKVQLVEGFEQKEKGLRESLASLQTQHTMLKISELLLKESIEEKSLRKFMEARNLDWEYETIEANIPDFKKFNTNEVFVENSDVQVQDTSNTERLRLVFSKLH